MSFWERYEELRKRIKAKVDAPCDTPEEQATHDRLAACDNLHHNEGHTPQCAGRQVFKGEPCTCHKGEVTA